MTKLKSPLLSMDAHGTISDAITFQRRQKYTFARTKPTPKNPRSLEQTYHRWLYEDYCLLWTEQTEAVKQTYRSKGAKCHLTGFSYWMSEKLTDLPDIAAIWRLDEKSGIYVDDSSRNANTGVITGASHAPGFIDYGLLFDGIDNKVTIALTPSTTNLTTALTIIATVYLNELNRRHGILSSGPDAASWTDCPWMLRVDITNQISAAINDANCDKTGGPILSLYTYYRLGMTYDKQYMRLYVNGAEVTNKAYALTLKPAVWPIRIAEYRDGYNAKGIIDNIILANRAFSPEQMRRDALRRYPL